MSTHSTVLLGLSGPTSDYGVYLPGDSGVLGTFDRHGKEGERRTGKEDDLGVVDGSGTVTPSVRVTFPSFTVAE